MGWMDKQPKNRIKTHHPVPFLTGWINTLSTSSYKNRTGCLDGSTFQQEIQVSQAYCTRLSNILNTDAIAFSLYKSHCICSIQWETLCVGTKTLPGSSYGIFSSWPFCAKPQPCCRVDTEPNLYFSTHYNIYLTGPTGSHHHPFHGIKIITSKPQIIKPWASLWDAKQRICLWQHAMRRFLAFLIISFCLKSNNTAVGWKEINQTSNFYLSCRFLPWRYNCGFYFLCISWKDFYKSKGISPNAYSKKRYF